MTQKRILFVGEGPKPSARQRMSMDAASKAGIDVEYRQLGKGISGTKPDKVAYEPPAPMTQEGGE